MPKPPRDLSNQRFGKLIAIKINGQLQSRTAWLCRCDCGKLTTVRATSLLAGYTTSCGCHRMQTALINIEGAALKHGQFIKGKPSKEYTSWSQMIQRCHNPNNLSYPKYGGAGISVANRYRFGEGGKTGVECFLEDIGKAPTPNHSVDRYPNKAGNYEPGNIRWASKQEQARNTNRNRYITYNGKTLIAQEWADLTGIGSATIRRRLQLKWSISDTLTTPVKQMVEVKQR